MRHKFHNTFQDGIEFVLELANGQRMPLPATPAGRPMILRAELPRELPAFSEFCPPHGEQNPRWGSDR